MSDRIHVSRRTEEEYLANEPRRLDGERLAEDQFFNLMMKCVGTGAYAFETSIIAKRVTRDELGRVCLQVVFTNADLQPVTAGLDSIVERGLWLASRPVPLRSKLTRGEANEGYFLPYEDDVDRDFLVAFEGLRLELASVNE